MKFNNEFLFIILRNGGDTVVDREDYEWLNQWAWYYEKKRKDNTGYVVRKEKGKRGKKIYMHRQILGLNPGGKLRCAHIDHNGLNNCKSNLKLLTSKEVAYNQQKIKKRKTTSKYKGVYWNKRYSKWVATIKVNYKSIHIGTYEMENDAAIAYNNAAKEWFGRYANLNVIS